MISTTDLFHTLANGGVRPLDWKVYLNFTGTPEDLSTRATAISVSRSLEFPYNVQSAIADVSLDNHDGYFTFAGLNISPIADYILPNRPIQIRFGFQGSTTVPNFTGYTEAMPEFDGEHDSVAKFTALDKLAQISDKHLPNMVMLRDVRTDEVIQAIFTQLGLSSSDYNLGVGVNVIPFVYFDADKSVGNALKELVQAENGRLWLDEEGVIQFEPRSTNVFHKPVVMEFNKTNTISISPSRAGGITNQVEITAEIRRIENTQQVFFTTNDRGYSSSASQDNFRVPANGQATFWLSFDDPVWTATAPTLNGRSNSSRFTAVNLSGGAVNSGVSATGTLFATTYKLVVTNTNSSPISLKSISIWGKPAKLIGGQAVEYTAFDDTSVEKFGTKSLQITENKCFGSVENIKQYAQNVLEKYADYSKQITLKVKGDPSLQLGDVVLVSIDDFEGHYEVSGITNSITSSDNVALETELTLQYAYAADIRPFVLDKSTLNGTDLLG